VNAPDTIASRLIGSLFVDRGLVSESQIRVALEIQRETGEQLGQILVQRFGVSRKELARVVAEQWRDMGRGASDPPSGPSESWRPLGEIFVTRGFISEEELDGALKRQRKTGERLGEALVALGVISKFELAGALAEQMATFGEPDDEAGDEQHATVHQLPDRSSVDADLPWGALTEEPTAVEPAEEHDAPVVNGGGVAWESTVVETPFDAFAAESISVEASFDAPAAESASVEAPFDAFAAESNRVDTPFDVSAEESISVETPFDGSTAESIPVETPFDAPVADVVAEAAEPSPDPVEAPETDLVPPLELEAPFDLWPEQVYSPSTETWPESAPEPPVEVRAEATVERAAEPELDLPADPEQDRGDDDLHDRHPDAVETLSVGSWHLLVSAQEPGLGVSVAFAPTSVGYRLVSLPDVPSVGQTIDIPGVGAQVVLRLGRSPLPGDIRVCVYLEEPVAQGGQADSAS
jgi:hypothetical protein